MEGSEEIEETCSDNKLSPENMNLHDDQGTDMVLIDALEYSPTIVDDSVEELTQNVENGQSESFTGSECETKLDDSESVFDHEVHLEPRVKSEYPEMADFDDIEPEYQDLNHECPVCKEMFSTIEDFQAHLDDSKCDIGMDELYECPICMIVVTSANKLKKHKAEKHPAKKKFKCMICKRMFQTSSALKSHTKTHQREMVHCTQCGKMCGTTHQLNSKASIDFKCYECDKSDSKGKDPVSPATVVIEHDEMSAWSEHVCTKCKSSFSTTEDLSSHTCRPRLSCSECGKPMSSRHSLKRHMFNIHAQKFKCNLCLVVFSDGDSLEEHLKLHKVDGLYKCCTCGYICPSESGLKQHYKTHEPKGEGQGQSKPGSSAQDWTSVCPECGKCFNSGHSLERHMLVHSEEKPHKCKLCRASYKERSKLTVHMRTHTGERPYICSICKAAFNTSGTLTKHTKTHTGDYAFVCSICSAKFIDKAALKRHSRVHTGERPYKCHLCPSAHSTPSALKIHIRTHTGEKPYMCSVCGKGYIAYSCLKDHLNRIHGMALKIDK